MLEKVKVAHGLSNYLYEPLGWDSFPCLSLFSLPQIVIKSQWQENQRQKHGDQKKKKKVQEWETQRYA